MGYLDNTGLAYLWGKIRAKLVQPDWQQNDETAPDYVKSRPGGYDEYDTNINITWDGVIGDKLTVKHGPGGYAYVKVSDMVLSVDQINGLTITANNGRQLIISGVTSANVIFYGAVAFVSTAGWSGYIGSFSIFFPESGIYFRHITREQEMLFIASLTPTPIPVKIPQKYLDLDSKADKPTTTEATLLASDWTGDSAPYSYNLSVTGVTATSNQEYLPALGITTEQLAALQAANIQDGGQSEGTVTLKAFGTKPTIDLPIRIILRGD